MSLARKENRPTIAGVLIAFQPESSDFVNGWQVSWLSNADTFPPIRPWSGI